MYKPVLLEERISINPSDTSSKEEIVKDGYIDTIILQRLRAKIEGKCISSGFVKPDSIEILHRSMGTAENGRFTGNWIYYVKIQCLVFYPETNTAITCKVVKVNKMGAYVVFDETMRVLLPRDLHLGNETFDALNPDDHVVVNVLRSRFQTNDPFISAVGLFISRSTVAAPASAPAPAPAVGGSGILDFDDEIIIEDDA